MIRMFDLLKALFDACDVNRDGFIDKSEVAELIRDQLLDAALVTKLASFDTDRNGKIRSRPAFHLPITCS
jgi:hypothetical protein